MRLQANIPATLPGQNVTFLLFGDVEITNMAPSENAADYTPMQAFLLKTGLRDAPCEEAPDSGLLVQTPEGVGEVTFNVNGVDVSMGSTVLFRAQPEGDMTVSTLEGSAFVETDQDVLPILAGTRLRVPLDRSLHAIRARLIPPEPYELRRLRGLPMRLLQRKVDINRPLTQPEMRALFQRIADGEPVCGQDPFPSCDRVPRRAIIRLLKAGRERLENRLQCVFRRGPDEEPLPPGETRPFCDELPYKLPCVFMPGPNDPPIPPSDRRPYCPQIPPEPTPTG
jgi:hypothetical protein